MKKPAILSPRCVHSPCAAMSHARRAGAALTAAPSTTHPGQARPGQPNLGREQGNALEAPDAPLSHPNTRSHLASPRPRETGLAHLGARCAPPSDPPVPAPPPPPPTRESNGDAHARHRRCTGAGSRAPMHARVQRCSFPAHARCCCSRCSHCSRRRHRRAEQRARPPLCRAVPCPPGPRAPSAPRRTSALASRGSSRPNSRRCRCRRRCGFKLATRYGRKHHLPPSHTPGRYANEPRVSSPLLVGPAPSVGTGAGSGGLLRNRPIARPAILVACK